MSNSLSMLIEAKVQPGKPFLEELGIKIGKLYTDHGFPVDMALDRLSGYTKLQKLSILDGVCQWLIEHRRLSAAGERAIERQRKVNKDMVERFINTGESGAY